MLSLRSLQKTKNQTIIKKLIMEIPIHIFIIISSLFIGSFIYISKLALYTLVIVNIILLTIGIILYNCEFTLLRDKLIVKIKNN
jgi:hypothetical protein